MLSHKSLNEVFSIPRPHAAGLGVGEFEPEEARAFLVDTCGWVLEEGLFGLVELFQQLSEEYEAAHTL